MGKRKINGKQFYTCDWTALPMSKTNAYLPTYNADGQLRKRGSYYNWEAALSHLQQVYDDDVATLEEPNDNARADYERAREHIRAQTSDDIDTTPPVNALRHFGGDMDVADWLEACHEQTNEVLGVVIPANGPITDILVDMPCDLVVGEPVGISGSLWSTGRGLDSKLASFNVVRKGKYGKTLDLTVFYETLKVAHNNAATQYFKQEIRGDVLVMQSTREVCAVPRTRYINYPLHHFEDEFYRSRRKKADTHATSDVAEYSANKVKMQESLDKVELSVTKYADTPTQVAHSAKCPPPSGKELAVLHPPTKRRRAGGHADKGSKRARCQVEAALAAVSDEFSASTAASQALPMARQASVLPDETCDALA